MAWSHLDITKPHLVYVILGGFTTLFMLCSSFIKERMYIGEATVATLCGVIFGPHAANLINPNSWGSVDIVTVEFSRIVLVVQCFAVGVELPKFYMERHWRSVVFLLVPVMTAGWLLVSLFIWWMIPPLNWLESLVVAACVTATDPVLASSVVGKGKFAKRVPKHLRDLLSAESGCNDGMAFPFVYLSLYLIQFNRDASEVTLHFVVYVILYECIFGAIYGFAIGYIARHGIRLAEKNELIDRESFLVFYFVVALFCAGSGSILGMDDLLVGFAAGVGFSNDGWFLEKTEESHVSNVIDLLLNLAYFVYFGTIIPWEQYNSGVEGLKVWRLVVIAIFVLLFRRIPIMLALKPLIPDVRNWREALFAGHFGPIGVGAIFVAILARAELEHEEPVPLSALPPPNAEHYTLIYLVWPIVTFLVISSIMIHGSSIAVFTLGKRINTLTLTMSYTAAPEDGPSWMNRLPRISSQSRSMGRSMSEGRTMSESSFDLKDPQFPSNTLAPPTNFLRRQRDGDHQTHSRSGSRASSLVSRRRKHKKWDDGIGPGGPISQSAIFPNKPSTSPPGTSGEIENEPEHSTSRDTTDSTAVDDSPSSSQNEKTEDAPATQEDNANAEFESPHHGQLYEEGSHLIFEDEDGEVVATQESHPDDKQEEAHEDKKAKEAKETKETKEARPTRPQLTRQRSQSNPEGYDWTLGGIKRRFNDYYDKEVEKRKEREKTGRRNEPARAYQFGNTIIVEDEDGEVVKTFELPAEKKDSEGNAIIGSSLKYLGLGSLSRPPQKSAEATAEEGNVGKPAGENQPKRNWWGGAAGEGSRRKSVAQGAEESDAEDKNIRFTIGGMGKRMNKDDFIREVQKLDTASRKDTIEASNASDDVKAAAAKQAPIKRRATQPAIPRIVETRAESEERTRAGSASPARGRSSGKAAGKAPSPPAVKIQAPDDDEETAVERKRRLAVLASQADDDDDAGQPDDTGETPAERRRRQAALGMGGSAAVSDSSDSDEDDNTPRVPPARRGIRFAEQPSSRR